MIHLFSNPLLIASDLWFIRIYVTDEEEKSVPQCRTFLMCKVDIKISKCKNDMFQILTTCMKTNNNSGVGGKTIKLGTLIWSLVTPVFVCRSVFAAVHLSASNTHSFFGPYPVVFVSKELLVHTCAWEAETDTYLELCFDTDGVTPWCFTESTFLKLIINHLQMYSCTLNS